MNSSYHPPKGLEAVLAVSSPHSMSAFNENLLEKLSQETNATLLAIQSYHKEEHGIKKTIIIGIQAESHLTITIKETDARTYATIEDFTCGEEADPRSLLPSVSSLLKQYFPPETTTHYEGWWKRGDFVDKPKKSLYHAIEIQGLSAELLNDKEMLEEKGKALLKTLIDDYDYHYAYAFHEDLMNPQSPLDGYSGYIGKEDQVFYYHTYPKEGILLASLSLSKPQSGKSIKEILQAQFRHTRIAIASYREGEEKHKRKQKKKFR